MTRKIQRYGWKRDLPDIRDRKFTAARIVTGNLPPAVDLRPKCPAVYDQGNLGSCTANAIAGALHFSRMDQFATPDYVPSRLFIYYNERVIEDSVGQDSGAELRDGLSSVAKQGAPPEDLWPYDEAQFAAKPPDGDYTAALEDLALQYERLDNTKLDDLKACLAGGVPFVFGFTVYQSFEGDAVASTGVVPMPAANEQVIGGHAVMCVGYDDASGALIVRNSWGASWGKDGYFLFPYAYATSPDLASDFWAVQLVGQS